MAPPTEAVLSFPRAEPVASASGRALQALDELMQAEYDNRPIFPPIPQDMLAMSINMTPLVPLIRCTMPIPCGSCWYCKQAEARR
jgi:hypothetical protein